MRLYLVQHGEALPKDMDPDRALSERGREDMERLAAFLVDKIEVARVVHSGKTRARQSAELLALALAPDQPVEAVDGVGPKDAIEPYARKCKELSENTLVVGHLPFMEKLVASLVTGSEDVEIVGYRPGSMVCLESGDNGGWQIQWMIRPELLGG